MDFNNNYFLAKRLGAGDPKAYDYLMNTYYRSLCTYAHTLTRDHSKAEDIVQNVFVRYWSKREKIDAFYSIKNYLYKAVHNEFIDEDRKKKPILYMEKRYLEAIDLVVENDHKNLDELIEQMNAEINKLPKKCKKIFLLNKKEGLTHIEISKYLGISIKTIEGHMTRAFKILNERLGAKFETILFMLFTVPHVYKSKN